MNYRSSDPYERRTARKWWALLIAAAIAALFVGWLIGRTNDPSEDGAGAPRATETSPGSGLSDRTEDGAVAAATTFARIMGAPTGEPDEYRDAMAALAAPGWRDRALELADNVIAFVEERYGRGGRASFNPIRYRTDTYTDDAATVEIWGVVLGSGPKLGGIEESWVTATLRLVWIEDEWKVRGQSSRGGPTPESLRTDGQAAVPSAVEGFEEYDHAPQP